jgi:hypothetical protein
VELMPQVPEHPHLKALGREVERTARRVGQLDDLVRSLADDVATLSRHLGATAPGPGATPPVQPAAGASAGAATASWLLVSDPVEACTALANLIDWLDRVYLAYPETTLPSCWLWHPDVVEELWWLRCAHAEAYHPETGSWLRAGDWHDRQRPNVARRLRAAIRTCELSEHRAGHPAARPASNAPLAEAARDIAAWVAAGRPGIAPEPTEAQLAEAEELHRRELERARNRR